MRAITLTIKNDLGEFKRVMPGVISFLQANDVPPRAVYSTRVAVEELTVNVIRYGYDDQRVHEITMALHIEDGYVVVSVEDDGRPFDPRAVETPNLAESIEERRAGGWGLHLVRLMSEDMTYRRLGDRNQVRVRVAMEPTRT